MRWYEYKMETDDLYAPDDLKAKLLAMTDQLTEERKRPSPMMKNRRTGTGSVRPGAAEEETDPLPRKAGGRTGGLPCCVRGRLWCFCHRTKSALAQRAAARRSIILRTALRR